MWLTTEAPEYSGPVIMWGPPDRGLSICGAPFYQGVNAIAITLLLGVAFHAEKIAEAVLLYVFRIAFPASLLQRTGPNFYHP